MTKGKRHRKREEARQATQHRQTGGAPIGAVITETVGDSVEREHANATENKGEKHIDTTPKTGIRTWIKENANVVIAIFTVVIAVIAGIQACIYKSQLSMMRIDQRPWVSVTCDVTTKEGRPIAQCVNINSGKTPAKRVHGYLFFRSFPMDSDFKFVDDNPKEDMPKMWHGFKTNVMFPNKPHPSTIELMRQEGTTAGESIPWTKEMQAAYDAGNTYFEWHGRYTYDDAAGISHWTQFCDMVSSGQPRFKFDTGMKCNEYNSVDDNK